MTSTVEVRVSSGGESPTSDQHLQFLPAKIMFDGTADNDCYFNNFTETKSDGSLKNSFRGYPLDGRVVEIPKTYTAFVVEGGRNNIPASGDEIKEIKMRTVKRLNKLTVWNYDTSEAAPGENPISRAFDWLEIARSVAGESNDDEEKENSTDLEPDVAEKESTKKRKLEDV